MKCHIRLIIKIYINIYFVNNIIVTDPVHELLVQGGPLLSGDIQDHLIREFNLSRLAARKRIERSSKIGNIQRFISISNRGYVYYIEKIHDLNLLKKIST